MAKVDGGTVPDAADGLSTRTHPRMRAAGVPWLAAGRIGEALRMGNSMDTPAPSRAAEIEALSEAYAALNRNDIPAFATIFDPRIERIEPADFPQGGTYHGLEAVKAHISKGRGSWAEGSCEPERFIVVGERIIVLVAVRLKHEVEWREGRIADVYTFLNGKAIQFRTFADEGQALDWARSAPDTPSSGRARG